MTDTPLQDKTPEELRPELIEALLPHAAFDGWTWAALDRAADDLGIERGVAHLAFPGGSIDMIKAHFDLATRRMGDDLAARGIDTMRIRDKITACVRVRLERAAPHREATARALSLLSQPQHAGVAARAAWDAADAMWRAIGDTSTDINWYSKRTILAGVYTATVLYWLDDNSEDQADTWAFLDRRIDDVMKIEKAKAQWRKTKANLPSLTRFLGRLRYPAA